MSLISKNHSAELFHKAKQPTLATLLMRCLLTILTLLTCKQAVCEGIAIIPKPMFEVIHDGHFVISEGTTLVHDDGLESEANDLAKSLGLSTDATANNDLLLPAQKTIRLSLVSFFGESDEGYLLQINEKEIHLLAGNSTGIFWGIQTLKHIFHASQGGSLQACLILDKPRFTWRGVMLDVGRHMYDVENIKKLLDWMASHKLNKFHWHLTEDQGWRIEIKKYPKLTSIGSIRNSSPPYGDRYGSDSVPYKGYYSQEEIKEVVSYAAERHITIIPEIDMPGHMSAAIAAYPELGNDDIPDYDPHVATHWGVKQYTLSPKEETFAWIEAVLSEVCELFPSEYIHIGGDEAPKEQWKQSKFAQETIKKHSLKDEEELQSWFIRRVDEILKQKGRKLVGWNEIRQGGLSPDATVMAWQGWDSGVDSAKEGHDVIMAPKTHTYLDYYQSSQDLELAKGKEYEAIGGYLPLAKVYDFNPVPREIAGTNSENHILGCQSQIWTEYIKTWDKLEYMSFPRLYALAEVAWTRQEHKDYEDFLERLKPNLDRLSDKGFKFFDPFETISFNTMPGSKITTSMPTYGISSPELSYDGNKKTYFHACRSPTPDDHFTLSFQSPIGRRKVKIITGSAEFNSRQGKLINSFDDAIQHGVLEAKNGEGDWEEIAIFSNGIANGETPKGCTAIRIRPKQKHDSSRLVIQDISFGKKSILY